MVTLKKEACTLKNGKLYYFNGKGIRVTKKSWQKISGNKYIQIGSKGYVVSKIEKTKNIWKYHKYSYQKKKWLKQKNVWLTVSKKKYYFNNAGNCTHIYDSAAQKYYDYRDGAMTVVKNDVRSIGKKEYYFGSNGIKSSVPGLYLTASGTLVYAAADGCVTKKIYGEIQAYTEAEGRITSCRIKEDHYMSYYNGNGDAVRKIDLYQPMVALTYDDGPSVHTWAILDVLAQNGGVATFFVVGQQVPANSAVVRRAVELGCEIGNHTYSHQNLTKVGVAAIQSQIWTTNFMVQNAAGVCPVVMRPPGGNYNHTVQNTVGMPIILWSIDTLDWKTRNAASTQAAVLNHVKDGDIILMHDLYSQTADASRVIIPELKNRGYQLVTISELADCRGPIYGGGVYHSLP
ncbi:MAG: polysaccharide deacetylase family protein [Lachnospiraceae bacterium]|nr:polysaccharide deacetylase family protein [Lachnospiraceae bacterium]